MAYQMIFRTNSPLAEKTERTSHTTLKEAQTAVGGLIQGVAHFVDDAGKSIKVDGQPVQIWVNEEGLLQSSPQVNKALMAWMNEHGCTCYNREALVGDALVLVGKASFVR